MHTKRSFGLDFCCLLLYHVKYVYKHVHGPNVSKLLYHCLVSNTGKFSQICITNDESNRLVQINKAKESSSLYAAKQNNVWKGNFVLFSRCCFWWPWSICCWLFSAIGPIILHSLMNYGRQSLDSKNICRHWKVHISS